jgi:hypothetical protein
MEFQLRLDGHRLSALFVPQQITPESRSRYRDRSFLRAKIRRDMVSGGFSRSRAGESDQPSIIVVMDDGLAAVAVRVFPLDDRGPVARFALPDNSGAITIAVAMFGGLADRYACADGTDANTNIIGERRHRNRSHQGRSQQILLHVSPPGSTYAVEERRVRRTVPDKCALRLLACACGTSSVELS